MKRTKVKNTIVVLLKIFMIHPFSQLVYDYRTKIILYLLKIY